VLCGAAATAATTTTRRRRGIVGITAVMDMSQ